MVILTSLHLNSKKKICSVLLREIYHRVFTFNYSSLQIFNSKIKRSSPALKSLGQWRARSFKGERVLKCTGIMQLVIEGPTSIKQ